MRRNATKQVQLIPNNAQNLPSIINSNLDLFGIPILVRVTIPL